MSDSSDSSNNISMEALEHILSSTSDEFKLFVKDTFVSVQNEMTLRQEKVQSENRFFAKRHERRVQQYK